jgi:hypothetical protein
MATIDSAAVFEKTALGHAAIGRRPAGLGALYRQVLIVIDGRKNLAAVASLFPRSDIAQVATRLWRAGLIGLASGLGPATADALDEAKQLMAISAKEHIGLLACRLLVRIDAAQSPDQLAAVASHWHMALRDSKHGKAQADELLARLRQIIKTAAPSTPGSTDAHPDLRTPGQP